MSNSTTIPERYITQRSAHRLTFRTPRMDVPAEFFMSRDLLPGDDTFAKVENIASNKDVLFRNTVAMPDVCSKPGRKNASGTTVVSEKYILPQVNDSDPNCGMRVVATSFHEDNISLNDVDTLFAALVTSVPTKKLIGTYAPFRTVVDICRMGTRAAIDHFGIATAQELENSQNGGNFFDRVMTPDDIFNAIPRLYLHFAQMRLGIIGAAGNHFLDLMKVTDIADERVARLLGIRKGQYLFMIHTGSGILGQYTMYTHTAKKPEHLSQALMVALGRMTFRTAHKKTYTAMQRKIARHMRDDTSLLTYDGDGADGKLYMTARAAASNFGTANRAVITHNIARTIADVLGRDPQMRLIYDMPHISITRENHFGTNVWVHRSNTSRAYGPSRMRHHPVFSQTGEPAFIPSSMSTDAYICVGTDRNTDSFFSAPHGTGKGTNTREQTVTTKNELFKKMESKGMKLYNAKSSIVINQDSARYKDIARVIAGVEDNGIGRVVATMRPVRVIMY